MGYFGELRNSKKYSPETLGELNLELLDRTQATSPGFFMASAWVIYGALGAKEFQGLMSILGSLLLFISIARHIVIRLYQTGRFDFDKAVFWAKTNIITNGILWAVVIMVPVIEFHFKNSVANINVLGVILGFSLSSVVTLSFHLGYAYFFQWIILLPSTAYLLYLANTEKNDIAFNAAAILLIAIFYLVNQTRNVHNQTVRRIKAQFDLKKTNELLSNSEKALLDEKAKLQHSIRLAAVGEISGEIAHEINNPLNLIVGYLELAMDELKKAKPDMEMVVNKIGKTKSAISRITKIIRGLRHYSRSTVNEPFVPVFLNEIIEDAADFCSEKFSYHQVELKLNLLNDYKIFCRPIEISQVVLNIFTNAIDEVSGLDAKMRNVYLRSELVDNTVKVFISNDGPKVDAAIRDKLFLPFFSTKKVGIGTGLGLSISKNIIENHNGRLYYDEQFENTTFVIELPVAPKN